MHPWLIQLSSDDQNVVAICYLDYLTKGHTIHGYYLRYATLLDYVDSLVAWVQGHTGCDIWIQPNLAIMASQWLPHPILIVIYNDSKLWQGTPNHQDPISKSMIIYLIDLMVGKDPHYITNAIIDFLIM